MVDGVLLPDGACTAPKNRCNCRADCKN
jgi:hypothetical protein